MSDDVAAFDERMMRLALEEAESCLDSGDVPVGAVIARDGDMVAATGNARERMQDPTAHAELLALREASEISDSWRLDGSTMYVTLEPCAMCAGAIVLARVPLVVFGTPDDKAGAVVSVAQLFEEPKLNHHPRWRLGVRRAESEAVLREFFSTHRGVPSA